MKWPTKFSSVHDYLDEVFNGITPTENEIVTAKKWYWRCYNTDLKRKRKQYTNLSIYFTKKQIQQIKAITESENVSDFIKKIVLSHIDGTPPIMEIADTAMIEQQLFLIAEYLTEIIANHTVVDMKHLQLLEGKITSLQAKIEQEL